MKPISTRDECTYLARQMHSWLLLFCALLLSCARGQSNVDLCATEFGCRCGESVPMVAPADSIEYIEASYEFYSTPASWCNAESACRERGGNLASVLTSEEKEIVAELCNRNLPNTPHQAIADPDQGCWIGLTDRDPPGQPENSAERKFRWSDGSAVGQTLISSMWYRSTLDPTNNQPDDKSVVGVSEDCVLLYKPQPGWHDWGCDAEHTYICKVLSAKPAGTPSSSTTSNASVINSGSTTQAGGAIGNASNGTNFLASASTAASAPPAAAATASDRLTASQIATIVGPIVSGFAGLLVAAYTGWKWYHKRKHTLVKLQTAGTTSMMG